MEKSLIIHEENTKEITDVKESVYWIQIHVDLNKLEVFSSQIPIISYCFTSHLHNIRACVVLDMQTLAFDFTSGLYLQNDRCVNIFTVFLFKVIPSMHRIALQMYLIIFTFKNFLHSPNNFLCAPTQK